MKNPSSLVRSAQLLLHMQRLTREVEELVPDLEDALTDSFDTASLGTAARSLQRAADAARAVVEGARPGRVPEEVREMLEGTSPVFSFLGSRLVLARKAGNKPAAPSVAARALAVLMEDPKRSFDAAEIAGRLGCTIPIARTALHRLVKSRHATRPSAGRFRAKSH
jgi:hypothetical protein